ncbi:Transcription factor TGA1 [Spatholobus suberectus]|nr:Transcription factor TGA1 [Spatholobus suberectus]
MNAAPFFLPMHTQHTESFPTDTFPPFSASTGAASPHSVTSNSHINDTLNGVPGTTDLGLFGFGSWPALVSYCCCCVLVPLTEPQRFDAYSLEKSCQQGMEKLQQMLADTVGPGQLVERTSQVDAAMERLEPLLSFVN